MRITTSNAWEARTSQLLRSSVNSLSTSVVKLGDTQEANTSSADPVGQILADYDLYNMSNKEMSSLAGRLYSAGAITADEGFALTVHTTMPANFSNLSDEEYMKAREQLDSQKMDYVEFASQQYDYYKDRGDASTFTRVKRMNELMQRFASIQQQGQTLDIIA